MIDSTLTTNLPWSHPSVFQTILVMTGDPKIILSCRAVCSSWRDWVDQTGSLWGKMIPSLLKKAVRRMPMIDNLYQVWDLRLDLLLEMEDEVENEHQTRCLAFRLDRAIHQKLYYEYEDTLELLDELATAKEEGEMLYSSPTGPISLFVRCKVSHPAVLRIVGECLANHLNTVVIDIRDRESAIIRQSLLRAMIGCSQAPRWVFKDMVGWLSDKLVVEDVNNADDEEEQAIEIKDEPTTTSSMFSTLLSAVSSFCSSVRGFIFSYMFSSPRHGMPEMIEQEEREVDEDEVFQLAPSTPLNPDFPTVLELLDFDAPWLRALLVEKAKIDKIIVLPNFQNFSLMEDLMDSNLKIVGYDEDSAVVQMDCSSLQSTDQGVVIGSIDSPADIAPGRHQPPVHYWEGRDIADRWPKFKMQLDLLPRDWPNYMVNSGNVVSGDENTITDESLDSSDEDEGSEDLSSSDSSEIGENQVVKKKDNCNFMDIRVKITEDIKESCSSEDESSEDSLLSKTEDKSSSNENGDSGENCEIFDMPEENLDLQNVKMKEVCVYVDKLSVGVNNGCYRPVMMNEDHSVDNGDQADRYNNKDMEEFCCNVEYNSEDSLSGEEKSSSSEIGDASDNSKVDDAIDDNPELQKVKIIDTDIEVIKLQRVNNSYDIKAFNDDETLNEED